jgi:hypothetical protein
MLGAAMDAALLSLWKGTSGRAKAFALNVLKIAKKIDGIVGRLKSDWSNI